MKFTGFQMAVLGLLVVIVVLVFALSLLLLNRREQPPVVFPTANVTFQSEFSATSTAIEVQNMTRVYELAVTQTAGA